jgi:hypothetical protein
VRTTPQTLTVVALPPAPMLAARDRLYVGPDGEIELRVTPEEARTIAGMGRVRVTVVVEEVG